MLLVSVFFVPALVHGCTYFEVPQKDVGLVIGRAMELGDVVGSSNMHWRVSLHPRKKSDRYGYVSVDGVGMKPLPAGLPLVTEGMNENGLTISANTLHRSVYESRLTLKRKVVEWDVVPSILSNFSNVSDALEGLKGVAVVGGPDSEAICGIGACFHWAIADKMGNSAIVEYIKGKLVVYDGPKEHVGVMTNDPPLDWQMTNLNQFVNVRPDWPDSNADIVKHLASGTVPQAVGHGYNLIGLPGDPSPPSRFVRAFFLREFAIVNRPESVATQENAIVLATGILNNVYLVKGTVAKKSMLDAFEYSPWAVIKIPKSGVFLYRTAADLTWKQITLSTLNFEALEPTSIQLSQTELGIQDVSAELSPKRPMGFVRI